MKKIIFTLKEICFVSLIFFNFGCDVGKEVRRETIAGPGAGGTSNRNQPQGLPDLGSNGGSHTGGGNGVEGTTLEDFRQNISETVEYKNQILPLIQKLSKSVPNLAADLIHIAAERKWYFVPIELNSLPASQIGVRFTTDQLAIHKRKEIWISTIHYNKMNELKKATLLIHELIMGVRLLDFQDKLDQCLARSMVVGLENTAESQKALKEARRLCFANNSNLLDQGREMRLGDDEHADIRDLTDKLLNNADTLEATEILGWIKAKNFRHWE